MAYVAHIIFFLDSVALITPILRKKSLVQGQVMALMTILQTIKSFGDQLPIEAKQISVSDKLGVSDCLEPSIENRF